MPQTVRQDSTTSNATPHSRLTQRGHVTVAMPQYRDYKRGLMTWLIPIVVLGFLIIFFVVLIVFMPPVGLIDNYISRSVDERLRLCQRQRLADCPPCRPGDDTSTNTECCELDDDGSSSIQKLIASEVDKQLQEHLARYGQIQINGNKTVKSDVLCAVHVFLGGSPQRTPDRGNYATVVGWDDIGQSAFIRPCINYNRDNGNFRVFQDGLYVIISHLAFTGDESSQIYGQRIMRAVFDEPVLVDFRLLNATAGVRSGTAPVHNSVAAGVARLRTNQLLRVEAKPIDRLARGNGYSYFSIVKLQNG